MSEQRLGPRRSIGQQQRQAIRDEHARDRERATQEATQVWVRRADVPAQRGGVGRADVPCGRHKLRDRSKAGTRIDMHLIANVQCSVIRREQSRDPWPLARHQGDRCVGEDGLRRIRLMGCGGGALLYGLDGIPLSGITDGVKGGVDCRDKARDEGLSVR